MSEITPNDASMEFLHPLKFWWPMLSRVCPLLMPSINRLRETLGITPASYSWPPCSYPFSVLKARLVMGPGATWLLDVSGSSSSGCVMQQQWFSLDPSSLRGMTPAVFHVPVRAGWFWCEFLGSGFEYLWENGRDSWCVYYGLGQSTAYRRVIPTLLRRGARSNGRWWRRTALVLESVFGRDLGLMVALFTLPLGRAKPLPAS